MQKQVLLIGASGGLGSSTIDQLVKNNWHVFAADIREEILTTYKKVPEVTPLVVDITKDASVQEAFNTISARTEGLNAVINMAGILKIGSMVELPVSELENALQINLLGSYRINKQFLSLLKVRKGRIINLSSEAGKQRAAPFNGVYAISKHALEAYSDALRRELVFLDLKVIKIQPGPFKTNMTKNAEQQFIEAEQSTVHFKKNLSKGISYLPRVYKKAHNPELVAKIILIALTASRPKTAYSVKTDVSRYLLDRLPVKWADRLIKKVLE